MLTLTGPYTTIMLAAACCMLITGFILALVKSPADERAAKFRLAKWTLTGAVLLLGLINLIQVLIDAEGEMSYLGPCIALAIGFVQAMLFTNSLMTLIRPQLVTKRIISMQAAVIVLIDTVLITCYVLLPTEKFLYIYFPTVVLYLVQLAYYILWFHREYKVFYHQIEQFYEEDEILRSTSWIRLIFITAVIVALLSLLMLFNERYIDLGLTIALALLYALFAASFVNYGLSAPVILPAIYTNDQPQPSGRSKTDMSQLELWIKSKGYLNSQLAVSDIARQTGITVEQLHQYFRDVIGEEFRTWRIRRRIDEAKRIMTEHPELSTTNIGKHCGFNDRSFFYQQFQRFTSVSIAQYRKQISPKEQAGV